MCIRDRGVFAVGDLVSRIQLAHVAAAQGTYVVEKIAGMAHGCLLYTSRCV